LAMVCSCFMMENSVFTEKKQPLIVPLHQPQLHLLLSLVTVQHPVKSLYGALFVGRLRLTNSLRLILRNGIGFLCK